MLGVYADLLTLQDLSGLSQAGETGARLAPRLFLTPLAYHATLRVRISFALSSTGIIGLGPLRDFVRLSSRFTSSTAQKGR
ncbi:hypothetical protein HKBW3S25_00465 [Candidatus Hakubella thermalkaliphila]|uniref:Uncharacterized protein n=2 Tax=Candidatus Hakubella thermalkaliphila TaxID=2754717 RepID=A0A6V8QHY2_9ACTN|nr:hypothetical protein [Bacillota bacterium]GFP25015.1 hypothetical protein HKBW3S25_00465 [Candidatus Hakubella thermalkaliphila]GFP43036.1 hypothetical protein HKBW3C_02168 [Candidatus Hakubella thermalkaliphila]